MAIEASKKDRMPATGSYVVFLARAEEAAEMENNM